MQRLEQEYTVIRPDGTHYRTDEGGARMASVLKGYSVLQPAVLARQPEAAGAVDVDARARELLAAEYERDGLAYIAQLIRTPGEPLTTHEERAFRATRAALREQPKCMDCAYNPGCCDTHDTPAGATVDAAPINPQEIDSTSIGGATVEGRQYPYPKHLPNWNYWRRDDGSVSIMLPQSDLEAYVDTAIASALAPAAPGDGCHKLDTPSQVFFYEQDFYVLSNFSAFTLQWDGWRFDTSEAAYHYEKFKFHAPEVCDAIRSAPSAHEAFKVAERNKDRRNPEWDSIKISVMRAILREKASQHEYVRRKLLSTGNRELIEDSWRDDYWGWGPNRDGQNWLGRLWMEVRAELAATPTGDDAAGGS